MVHDPMTLDLGEGWHDKTLTATSKQGNLTATGFAFAAEATQTADGSKHDQGYGVGISYATETAHAGVDYINNLGESGGFTDVNNSSRRSARCRSAWQHPTGARNGIGRTRHGNQILPSRRFGGCGRR